MITLSKMALFCTDVHSVGKVPVIEAILGSMLITFIFPVHSLTLANTVVRLLHHKKSVEPAHFKIPLKSTIAGVCQPIEE